MLKLYFNLKMLKMLSLGFASGFPFLLVFSTFSLWLKDAGLSLAIIGIFSLVKIPYAFKWAFSPFIDSIKLPIIGRLGRRRSWALLLQMFLMASIFGMSCIDPQNAPYLLAGFAILTAFFSACLDIVLDAYRIESFDEKTQAGGVATFVLGYRFGIIVSGAGALFMAVVMDWNTVYALLSLCTLLGIITILLSKEPISEPKNFDKDFFQNSVVAPLQDFFVRKNAWLILLFIMLYRLPETYIGPMMLPFYAEMGFSKIEIATISKIYGVIATISGGFIGGYIVHKLGLFKGLIYLGIFQGLTNFLYVYQADIGYNPTVLTFCIVVENISAGMGATAFVAYMSSLCNKNYTATQYALLSSLMSVARDVFSSSSGWAVATIGWQSFFALSAFFAIPGLLLLIFIEKRK